MEQLLIPIVISFAIIILLLIVYGIYQIESSGLKVNDFFDFVKANDKLQKLAAFSKKYEKLDKQSQIIFSKEAANVFKILDNVPAPLWEDEYKEYMTVLNRYNKIRRETWEKGDLKRLEEMSLDQILDNYKAEHPNATEQSIPRLDKIKEKIKRQYLKEKRGRIAIRLF